jgi:hypothetical protein
MIVSVALIDVDPTYCSQLTAPMPAPTRDAMVIDGIDSGISDST